ncbi:dephospho-CoA kinase [Aquibium sp. ELW1220]|uniref:dephospho-CoA kinase n=1 Tax=Aquibium sp. ELW1220 TaxID=2976766 RepID=UPI0025B221FF|nr:dephospho-CoA kinase [Aquibium sp. ELW1220]MDN2578818.1 dephospho-CoA kinase [Aquibium sp. ELW1220]
MIILGLTGSIGMGKSTTAAMFAAEGVPVNDADAVVHELYRGKAVALVGAAFPQAIVDGIVDRNRLSAAVLGDPVALKRLEAIVHPLVREAETEFLARHRAAGTPLVVLDIPLLFEVGAEGRVDRIAVVSVPADVQRARVLARPGMTVEKFETILAKQVPDAEKRARADFVIDTARGLEPARRDVVRIIGELTGDGPA